MAKAIVHILLIDLPIERALIRPIARVVNRAGRREHAAVERRGRDGTRVHQRDRRGLPLGGLGTFAVGEVARGMPRGKPLVARHVARAEAGPAEAGLDRCARAHQGGQVPAFGQRQIHRQARGIHREREAAHAPAAQDGGRLGHVLVQAARAARNHALIHLEAAVVPLFPQPRRIFEDIRRVLQEFLNGVSVRRMIGQGNHGLEPGKVQPHKPIVIRALARRQRAEIPFPAMPRIKRPRDLVRRPNGRKAGGLRRHHVQRQAEIHGQIANARAHEFQDLIFHKPVLIHRAAQGQSRVVRAHAMGHFALHVYQDHLRLAQIVGLPQQLLYQLRATLAHAHAAQRTIARVAIRSEKHAAAFGHSLARILMDDRHIGRHINAAVFFRRRKAKGVVVLIDGAAHRAQTVVAIGERIGQREFRQPTGARGLNDAAIGDVVRNQRIETDARVFRVAARTMRAQNRIGHRATARGGVRRSSGNGRAVYKMNPFVH